MAERKVPSRLQYAEPPPFKQSDVFALKSLQDGTANEGQQQRALKWILESACGMPRDPFRPDNARLTDHLTGRQSVGRMILDLINAKAISNE